MKKRILNLLKRHVSRLKILYFAILVIVFASITVFYLITINRSDYISNLLTSKTEGNLGEDNSFLNMLLEEVKRVQKKEKTKETKEKNDELIYKIRENLLAIKGKLEDPKEFPNSSAPIKLTDKINIEEMNQEVLMNCLTAPNIKDLSLKQLNLTKQKVPYQDIKLYNLHSKELEGQDIKSFVFIPAPVVSHNENNEPGLPVNIKQEVIFSKLAEAHLIKLLELLKNPNKNVIQAYYVSLSGFLRICKQQEKESKNENLVDYYKDKFKERKSFSATTYFSLTLQKDNKVRESNLYIDVAGFGIVQTSTAAIINKNLNIIGIICIDVTQPIEKYLTDVDFGSSILWFKNYLIAPANIQNEKINSKTIISGSALKFLEKNEIEKIDQFYQEKPNRLTTMVNRFHENEGRIIYTVPIDNEKVAFFIFDKKKLQRDQLFFLLLSIGLLIIMSLLIFIVSKQHIKRIRTEQERFQFISHMHGSYVITDTENRILDYNEEFQYLVEDKDLEGKSFNNYLKEDSLKDFEFYLNSGRDRFECPLNIRTKIGNSRQVVVINTKTAYPLSKPARISILIESGNLEAVVAEKYADRISHLLKSPLHSILGIADQLRRKTARPRYDDYYRLLDFEIEGLKNEISRLLKMSRIEIKQLKPELEKLDLTQLVSAVKKEFGPVIKRKKLDFEVNITENVYILADKNMVKASIENILDNAFKYTIIGKISLRLSDGKDKAKIIIQDTGIGIPADEIDFIFKNKFRGKHPVVQQNNGQGIGLYQCKNFVELNHGAITVESAIEEGTTFTLTFPKNLTKAKGE